MNVLLLLLIFLGTATIQVLVGGMRPVFAIPGYLILALAGAVSVFFLRKTRPLPSAFCLVSSILFFSYILARTYTSPVEYLARPDRYMVLGCLVVYLVFALYVTDPRARMMLFFGFFLLALGHIAMGSIQFSKGDNPLPFHFMRPDYGRRASGFYVCPNHYAGLLEVLAILALSLGVWSRVGIKTRMLLLYFVPLALAGLALSGSRGGYLSTAVAFSVFAGLSLFVVKKIVPQRFLLVSCASLLVLACAGLAAVSLLKKSDFLAQRYNAIVDPSNVRIYLWEAAMKQWSTQPVTGTGAGTYLYLGRLYRNPAVTTDPVWVHNDYYHLLAEYGTVGAVLCGVFLLAHLVHGLTCAQAIVRKRLIDTHETTSNALALTLGAIAGVAAILAHSVVDFNAHIPGNALVLAALFGILANPPMQRGRPLEKLPWTAFPIRLLLPACAVVLLLDAAPHLPGEWHSEQARVALRDNKFLKTIRESQLGLEKDKTNPDLHYYLGEARRMYGNMMINEIARVKMNEAALVAFHDSIRLFPQDERTWVKASQALDILGRHDEALQHLDHARSLDPNLSTINTYYGAHYQIQGKSRLAMEYYQKASNPATVITDPDRVLHEIKEEVPR